MKVIGHMQICQPVDEAFTVPDVTPSSHPNPEDDLISRAAKIPNLQYRSNCLLDQQQDTKRTDVEDLLCSARALDREMGDWARTVPTTWSYSAALSLDGPASTNCKFTPGQVHRYQDFYAARVWNVYRVSRLIVQSVLIRATSWLSTLVEDSGDSIERKKAEGNSMELVNDICASVPFLLGHDLSRIKLPATSTRAGSGKKKEANRPAFDEHGGQAHTGRFSLIWPLHIACSSVWVPEAQRDWMRMQLRCLAERGESLAHFAYLTRSQILLGRADGVRFNCV